jgi:hypothetical protein
MQVSIYNIYSQDSHLGSFLNKSEAIRFCKENMGNNQKLEIVQQIKPNLFKKILEVTADKIIKIKDEVFSL